MNEPGGRFVFRIDADASQFHSEFAKIKETASGSAKRIETEFGQLRNRLAGIGRTVLSGIAATVGVATVADVLKQIHDRTVEGERSVNDLNAALRTSGNAAGVTRQQLEDLSDELKKSTVFDDDGIHRAEAALLRFRDVQGSVFEDALKLAPDVATALGTDIGTAAHALGRAIDDPEGGMRRLRDQGVRLRESQIDLARSFKQSGDAAGSARVVLEEITRATGGLSDGDTRGLYGATKRLENAWGDMLKTLGSQGFGGEDFRNHAAARFNEITAFLQPFRTGTREASGAIRAAGEALVTKEEEAAQQRLQAVRELAEEVAYNKEKIALQKRVEQSAIFYQQGLDRANAALAAQQSAQDDAYQHGETAAANYYGFQRQQAEDALRAQERFIDSQLKDIDRAFRGPLAPNGQHIPPSAEIQEGLNQRLRGFANQTAKNELQLRQRLTEANIAEARAVEHLADDYEALAIAVLEAQGNTAEAARREFELAHKQQLKQLRSELQSPDPTAAVTAANSIEQINNLRRLKDTQADLTQAVRDYDLTLQEVGAAQKSIELQVQAGTITELDGLAKRSEASRARIGQLRSEIALVEQLVQESGRREDIVHLEELKLRLQELEAQADLVGQKFRDIGESAFTSAFTDFITRTKSAKDAFHDFAKSIERDVSQLAAKQISKALFGEGSFLGDLFAGFSNAFASGSFPGFAGGTNYAPGGWAMVGERGPELVALPRGSKVYSHGASGGGDRAINVTNYFTVQGTTDRRSQAQIALQTGIAVQRAIARDA